MSWNERWGFDGDMAEVEQVLGLAPGSYRTQPTQEHVTLPDPHYPSQSQTFSIELLTDEATGRVWKYGLTEITNGIYALIWQQAREHHHG